MNALTYPFDRLVRDADELAARFTDEKLRAFCGAFRELRECVLARDAGRDALLQELALIASCVAADRVWEIVLDSLVRISGAGRGFLLFSGDAGVCDVVAARHMDRRTIDPATEEISRGVVNMALGGMKPVLIEDAVHSAPFCGAESVSRLKLLSVLCVPLMVGERAVGVVYLENRKARGAFGPDTERAVVDFVGRMTFPVHKARPPSALAGRRLACDGQDATRAEAIDFDGVVGNSPALREVLDIVRVAAAGEIPVLIEGESGTGKELLARAIHRQSPRRDGEFVAVNCAALPAALLESELFGHARGAFTGAVRDRRGLFATAEGGTLFLDEVGELPLELQAKLLRVLQSGEYRPLGRDQTLHCNVRVVAATQRRLDEEIAAGNFREDLYFRLNGVRVRVPPLRERKEDIPVLAERFLRDFEPVGAGLAIDRQALACLIAYGYPGNVRELETAIRRAVLFARAGRIDARSLPESITRTSAGTVALPERVPESGAELLRAKERATRRAADEVERAFLDHAMDMADGRPGQAARLVGMNRSQFARMLSKHGLSRRRGRPGPSE